MYVYISEVNLDTFNRKVNEYMKMGYIMKYDATHIFKESTDMIGTTSFIEMFDAEMILPKKRKYTHNKKIINKKEVA